jgi:hypothetical protein
LGAAHPANHCREREFQPNGVRPDEGEGFDSPEAALDAAMETIDEWHQAEPDSEDE